VNSDYEKEYMDFFGKDDEIEKIVKDICLKEKEKKRRKETKSARKNSRSKKLIIKRNTKSK
jgi:hypothetical protein